MSYKIEITADTLMELSGKLLALAGTMHYQAPADPVMPEVKSTPKPKKVKEVAEQAPVPELVTDAVETASSPNTTATVQPDPNASSETAKSTDVSSASSVSVEPARVPDFEKEVAPLVLRAVKDKGKPWVQDILSQFGVERASQVPDEHMAELVAVISEGLDA